MLLTVKNHDSPPCQHNVVLDVIGVLVLPDRCARRQDVVVNESQTSSRHLALLNHLRPVKRPLAPMALRERLASHALGPLDPCGHGLSFLSGGTAYSPHETIHPGTYRHPLRNSLLHAATSSTSEPTAAQNASEWFGWSAWQSS